VPVRSLPLRREDATVSERAAAAPLLVQGGSDVDDERDASSLGIAEEPVLAWVRLILRPASVRATVVPEGEVLGSVASTA
jgi:hypothetical protein